VNQKVFSRYDYTTRGRGKKSERISRTLRLFVSRNREEVAAGRKEKVTQNEMVTDSSKRRIYEWTGD